jgi:hypothetical protein
MDQAGSELTASWPAVARTCSSPAAAARIIMQAYLVSRRAVEEALSGPARVTVGDGEAALARSGCRVGPGLASDPGGPGSARLYESVVQTRPSCANHALAPVRELRSIQATFSSPPTVTRLGGP